jgi:hypothetical protein
VKSQREHLLLLSFLGLVLALYLVIAYVSSMEGDFAWVWAWVDGSHFLGTDDAYRYFLSKYAFSGPEIYSWDYVLPLCTFIFGTITELTGSSLFASRAVIILISLIGIVYLYRCLRELNINNGPAFAALVVYAFMPVVVMMNISFYGETLLMLFYPVGIFLWLRDDFLKAALVLSLLPLVRPEGIYLLAPFSIYFLLNRRYFPFLISGFAGFVYLVFLLIYFEGDISYLYDWRTELREVWSLFYMGNTYTFPFISTFNILWIMASVSGMLFPRIRRLWPLWLGPLIWFIFYGSLVATGLSSYVSRYFVACFPVMTIGFAYALDYIAKNINSGAQKRMGGVVVVLITGFIASEHLLQIDPLKNQLGIPRLPVDFTPKSNKEFQYLDESGISNVSEMADAVEQILEDNKSVDTLLVFDPDIFYFLSDKVIKNDWRVMLAPIAQQISVGVTGGSYFSYGQFGRKYRYFDLFAPQGDIEGVALYVGHLETPPQIPQFRFGERTLSVVGYRESSEPADMLEKRVWLYEK